MSHIIYASFADPLGGKSAVGALLDHGVRNDDISLVVNEEFAKSNPQFIYDDETPGSAADANAKSGITTTTGADAAAGAVKGAGVGAAVGILGALACLMIPGFGWVIGGGALATAVAAAAGTAVAGAIAGGAAGYLKDQGVPEEQVVQYDTVIRKGGALLSVNAPSGRIDQAQIEAILMKYGAGFFHAYPSPVVRITHLESELGPPAHLVTVQSVEALLPVEHAGHVDYVTPAEYVAPAAYVAPAEGGVKISASP